MTTAAHFSDVIHPERGFLPAEDPLRHLPAGFEELEALAGDLPKVLMTNEPRRLLGKLGPLPLDQLTTAPQVERAMMLLSYLGHGYVWSEKPAAHVIPASLAVPWHKVATRIGRPPILSYASYAHANWRRIEPVGPLLLGNIALLQNFMAGMDEEWFILIHVDIEALAAPALNALHPAQTAAANGDPTQLTASLTTVGKSLEAMNATMSRMAERCDPYIYYRRVRPYIHGWKNNPAVPDGVIYEGVAEFDGKPQKYRGETGSQSSIVPSLDAALGIAHREDELAVFLREMRDYMPPAHRAFIDGLEAGPNMRASIKEKLQGNAQVRDAYNHCIDQINAFRTKHLEYASSYIDKQAETDSRNPVKVGTGGTPFMTYLAKHQHETAAQRLDEE